VSGDSALWWAVLPFARMDTIIYLNVPLSRPCPRHRPWDIFLFGQFLARKSGHELWSDPDWWSSPLLIAAVQTPTHIGSCVRGRDPNTTQPPSAGNFLMGVLLSETSGWDFV